MTKDSAAQEIASLLELREEKVVFAESCTAGLVAATLAQIPGISKHLCGSLVTYHQQTKRKWLGINRSTIKDFTSESKEVANEMVLKLLQRTPNADWGLAVVGHLGPNAPKEKDGHIFVACARRTRKGRIKIKDSIHYTCKASKANKTEEGDDGEGAEAGEKKIISLRVNRQSEAAEVALTLLARLLHKKTNTNPSDAPKVKKNKSKRA